MLELRPTPEDYPEWEVALVGKESVSGSPAATGRGISQENPPMRIYVIGMRHHAVPRGAGQSG